MDYRNGNYSAFYVSEPFSSSNLTAYATKDFNSYNLLKAWKANDDELHFIDSHDKNYNVRDGSDWENTLKPRLHGRLAKSKNIILFLSSYTKNSIALKEEINYGINTKGLPVIVVYPEYKSNSELLLNGSLKEEVKRLWDKLPIFKNSKDKVPTLHIPLEKELIKKALDNKNFMVQSKMKPGEYIYKV